VSLLLWLGHIVDVNMRNHRVVSLLEAAFGGFVEWLEAKRELLTISGPRLRLTDVPTAV
jgi:hypothetical protein